MLTTLLCLTAVFLFWLILSVASGTAVIVVLLVLLGAVSRHLTGTLTLPVLATLLLAWQHIDLISDDPFYSMYLPLYMMAASVYLLIRLILFSPAVGDRMNSPGGSGGGEGGGGC